MFVIMFMIVWLLGLIYSVIYFSSLLYAILYALEKFNIIAEDNGFFSAVMGSLNRILAPFLQFTRSFLTISYPYDLSPFILLLILYILPSFFALISAMIGLNVGSLFLR